MTSRKSVSENVTDFEICESDTPPYESIVYPDFEYDVKAKMQRKQKYLAACLVTTHGVQAKFTCCVVTRTQQHLNHVLTSSQKSL